MECPSLFQKLVNRNDDLRRLVEKGYAVAFEPGYLIVRDIPYLDSNKKLQIGAIVTHMDFIDKERVKQKDHQVFFAGSVPHNLDGAPIPNLAGGPCGLPLSEQCKDVVVQRSFSNKPSVTGQFRDFFDKIESYVAIISGPAIELHAPAGIPLSFRAVKDICVDTTFKFHDTLTSRAEIGDLAAKLKDDVIAIIGLGGTGAYLLDFLIKCPVREIRAFDLDSFHVHNAFRSPGRLEESELGKSKAEVYRARYENFRNVLAFTPKFIGTGCEADLAGVTFAFVCVDKGPSRAKIFDLLLAEQIPFVDVGMGLDRKRGALAGMLRTTYYSASDGPKVREKGPAPLADGADDEYRNNIQISELNALNAALAVIKFKKIRSFYFQDKDFFNLLFDISDLTTATETELQ